jgi:general secretion pathway protein E
VATHSECIQLGLDLSDPPLVHRARGCPHCNDSGYRGRTGIYELIEVDDTLRQMIHDGAGERAMAGHVRMTSPSIRVDGVRRILDGSTSIEEVVRVTRED